MKKVLLVAAIVLVVLVAAAVLKVSRQASTVRFASRQGEADHW